EPRTVTKLNGAQAALRAMQLHDGLFPNVDAASLKLTTLQIRQACRTVRAEHDIVGPLPDQQSQPRALLATTVSSDRGVAVLPAIAVGTNVDTAPKQPFYPLKRRKLVNHTGRNEQCSRPQLAAVIRGQDEPIWMPVNAGHGGGLQGHR